MAIRNIYKGAAPGYFGSSLAQALVIHRRKNPLNPTVTELAMAATVLYTPEQLEKYCGLAGRRYTDPEAQAKADAANASLVNKLATVARGTNPNEAWNEAFRAFYNEWKDTDEGGKYGDAVIQFNPTGPGSGLTAETDDYIREMMEARSLSRGTGGPASASARLKQAEAEIRSSGSRTVSRQKLASILGIKTDDGSEG